MEWRIGSRNLSLLLEGINLLLVSLLQLLNASLAFLFGFALQLFPVFVEDFIGALVGGQEARTSWTSAQRH